MDDSPKTKLTLRQVLSRQWQIPLFILSMIAFAVVLLQLRPVVVPFDFEGHFENLSKLAGENRYIEFYNDAENLRLEVETDEQYGRLLALVAQARVKELRQRHEIGIEPHLNRSNSKNYELIIKDYTEALLREQPEKGSVEYVQAFVDLATAYWAMNNSGQAFAAMDKAIAATMKPVEAEEDASGLEGESIGETDETGAVDEGAVDEAEKAEVATDDGAAGMMEDASVSAVEVAAFAEKLLPELYRDKAQMLLLARPEGYQEESLGLLEKIQAQPGATSADKAWAHVREIELYIGRGDGEMALMLLGASGKEILESQYAGEVELLRGSALRQAGRIDEAEVVLRELLKKTDDRGDIYAQTALELGRINYDQYRDHDARRFYELVISTQMGKDWYIAANLGLAECYGLQQRYPEALNYYQKTVDGLRVNPFSRAINIPQVHKSLTMTAQKLNLLKQYREALPFQEVEQQIAGDDVYTVLRYAQTLARLAEELVNELNEATKASVLHEPTKTEQLWVEQQKQQINSLYEKSSEQYLKVAKLAVANDELYGQSLWQGAVNYDKSGNSEKSIATWRRFVIEREGQPRWPQGMFNLGQAYQAAMRFDEAITIFESLRQEHPKAIAAFEGMVPLAMCYLAKEPPEVGKAEELLLAVLQDPALTPRSRLYRLAMFELGELYYDNKQYPQAINILTEAIERYPQGPNMGKSMFLVADSYRQSGLALDEMIAQLSANPDDSLNQQKSTEEKQSYLQKARDYYDRTIEFYLEVPEGRRSELDNLYLRHCWLYRADCLFDLERYREAAQLYELAALRYQLTPTALAAFTQIINCQIKMDNVKEARSTTQRAIWQLKEIEDSAFATGQTKLSRQQWQSWFAWMEESNLW